MQNLTKRKFFYNIFNSSGSAIFDAIANDQSEALQYLLDHDATLEVSSGILYKNY